MAKSSSRGRATGDRRTTVAIVGLGLVGGSLGLALRRFAPWVRVIGHDLDPDVTRAAIERGVIESAAGPTLESLLDPAVRSRHPIVVAATPGSQIADILWRVGATAPRGTILTDVGSTKATLHEALDWALPRGVVYIGGHPMAGRETKGLAGADAHLFEGAVWVLTQPQRPGPGRRPVSRRPSASPRPPPAAAVARLRDLLECIGARVVAMDPVVHDRSAAAVSHVPYMAATALMGVLPRLFDDPQVPLALAASGFYDTTRVAAGPAPVYRDIGLLNASNVIDGLDALREELDLLRDAIARRDGPALERLLHAAGALRRTLPARHRPSAGQRFDMVAGGHTHGALLQALLAAVGTGVKAIVDLEVLHLHTPDEGSVRLSLTSAAARARTARALARIGLDTHYA